MVKVLKETDSNVRKFSHHYAAVIAAEGGASESSFFEQVFPSCFHLVQTDVKLDHRSTVSLIRLVTSELRRQDEYLVESNQRAVIIQTETIDSFLRDYKKIANRYLLEETIDLIKVTFILQPEKMESKASLLQESIMYLI